MALTTEAVDAIDTKLKSAHGEGSWTTATGFATPGDAMALTTEAVDAIDTKLKSAHGEGSWTTATGFAVAGDAMDLKTEAVEAIETKLKTAHGEGSWTTATGFAKPGDEMALSSQTVQAIAAAVPDPMNAVVPGTYGTGTAGEAIGKIKEQTDKAQFDTENRILASAEVTVTEVTLAEEAVDAIWNEPRGNDRPEGSFGYYLDGSVVESAVSTAVTVQPLQALVQTATGEGGTIELYRYARIRISWAIDVDVSGHSLYWIAYDPRLNTIVSQVKPEYIHITPQETGCLIEVDAPDTLMPKPGQYRWVLRDQTLDSVLLAGALIVQFAPDVSE
jgi:hypothetical protein